MTDVPAVGAAQAIVFQDHGARGAKGHQDDRRAEAGTVLAADAVEEEGTSGRVFDRFQQEAILGCVMERKVAIEAHCGALHPRLIERTGLELSVHLGHAVGPEAHLDAAKSGTGGQPIRVALAFVWKPEIDQTVQVECRQAHHIALGQIGQRIGSIDTTPTSSTARANVVPAQVTKVHRAFEREPTLANGLVHASACPETAACSWTFNPRSISSSRRSTCGLRCAKGSTSHSCMTANT